MPLPPVPQLDIELARRLHRALTAGSDELFQLILDPAAEVLRALLKNPQLGEDHLLALLKRRDLPEDLLKSLSLHEREHPSHRLKLAIVKNPATPGPVVLALLPHLHLFELVTICFLPGVTPDQKVAAERSIIQRLPNLELGNKITLARRATADVVAAILKEGASPLMEPCLNSPRLKEVAVLQFLNSAVPTAETISIIARHPRWQSRPNLRLAILRNHRTPAIWFTLFLPKLRRPDLNNLLAGRRLTPPQKQLVQEELQRRGGGR
jgi:hypothetical protein